MEPGGAISLHLGRQVREEPTSPAQDGGQGQGAVVPPEPKSTLSSQATREEKPEVGDVPAMLLRPDRGQEHGRGEVDGPRGK
jgi:hypothetical protein